MASDALTDDLLQRHRAFWEIAPVAQPLLSVGHYRPLEPRQPYVLADGTHTHDGMLLRPELVDACGYVKRMGRPKRSPVRGDFIGAVAPYDFCWNEAIAGCPIRWSAGHVWSQPFLNGVHALDRLQMTPDNPWLAKLQEFNTLLVEWADGRYPVGQPLLRGPVDIAAAALGDERLCWAMVDEPAAFRLLLEACTALFLAVARVWHAAVPPFHGGSCEYGIWVPGTSVRTQQDNAGLLSPHAYREYLRPCDERICAAYEYAVIHTHSGVLPIMVDSLVDLAPLRAVQVSLDWPAGPAVAELLPVLRKVNERKPLIITGAVTQAELDTLLKALSPRGLCLQVAIREEDASPALAQAH